MWTEILKALPQFAALAVILAGLALALCLGVEAGTSWTLAREVAP